MANEALYEEIAELARGMQEEVTGIRRDLHRHPEPGWTEVRTSSLIARRLTELGYEVLTGDEVTAPEARMGMPEQEELDQAYEQAMREGADPEFAPRMRNGRTGVVGILKNGDGPVVALRFDIDALYVKEASDEKHRPFREGYSSLHEGRMHACGHDGHTAMGLGVAKILMQVKDRLHGTVKLLFQPAEEGVRGARAVVERGHLDDVSYLIGSHMTGQGTLSGHLVPGSYGALATTKLDVIYHGKAAHAGASPEKGRNVMLGVAAAISNLYAIPRTGLGASRINVGKVTAGTGRNVIADYARMELEVRGETGEINEYMEAYARRIVKAAADMHGLTCEIREMGAAFSMHSDEALAHRVACVCREHLPDVCPAETESLYMGGSEDFSYMMKRVQDHGGEATFMRVLTPLADVLHGVRMDFDEKALIPGIEAFCGIVCDLLG